MLRLMLPVSQFPDWCILVLPFHYSACGLLWFDCVKCWRVCCGCVDVMSDQLLKNVGVEKFCLSWCIRDEALMPPNRLGLTFSLQYGSSTSSHVPQHAATVFRKSDVSILWLALLALRYIISPSWCLLWISKWHPRITLIKAQHLCSLW